MREIIDGRDYVDSSLQDVICYLNKVYPSLVKVMVFIAKYTSNQCYKAFSHDIMDEYIIKHI